MKQLETYIRETIQDLWNGEEFVSNIQEAIAEKVKEIREYIEQELVSMNETISNQTSSVQEQVDGLLSLLQLGLFMVIALPFVFFLMTLWIMRSNHRRRTENLKLEIERELIKKYDIKPKDINRYK